MAEQGEILSPFQFRSDYDSYHIQKKPGLHCLVPIIIENVILLLANAAIIWNQADDRRQVTPPEQRRKTVRRNGIKAKQTMHDNGLLW